MSKKRTAIVLVGALLLAVGLFAALGRDTVLAGPRGTPEVCGDGIDNDGDGAVDEAECQISETSSPTSGDGVVPELWGDNPDCSDLGYGFGFKLDGAPNGTFTLTTVTGVSELTGGAPEDPNNSVTVSSSNDEIFLDWSATLGMDAVIVKGGPNANVYVYEPEDTADTALSTPEAAFGISHVEFCYDYELDVSKDANTSFTRTYDWTIDKSVTPGTWDLFTGDSGTSEYTVSVERTGFVDSDWAVNGTITIENNTPFDATIESVTDEISGVGSVDVDCGVTLPHTLAAGNVLTCTYETLLPDDSTRTNTATVTTSGEVGGGEATASVDFSTATINEVNASVTVTDTNSAFGGPRTASGSDEWMYEVQFTCDGDEGTHDNTATIVETGQSASASVTVNCYALDVSKDATTSLTRTWNWTIDKSVTPDTWDLFTGDSGMSEYTVSVDKVDSTDGEWSVSGNITVSNVGNPIPAEIAGVSDMISPDIAATVDCGVTFPYTIAAGGTLDCTYSASLTDGSTRTNTATATLQNYSYASDGTPTAAGTTDFDSAAVIFDFDPPDNINEVNASINVNDSFAGDLGSFSDDGSTSYERTFACDGDEGTHDNTATIVETGQSDSASVTVNCYALDVTKDADTTFNRDWTWTIDKSADQTDLSLATGELATVHYTVMVDATATDSDWAVSGDIVITNPNPNRAATLTEVSDLVSPSIDAPVTCPALTVPAGGSLTCTYSASLPDDSQRTNTAMATLQNNDYNSSGTGTPSGTTAFSGQADVIFGDPSLETDECVDVSDTNVGFLGTVCAVDAPHTFNYSLTFGHEAGADVPLECGDNTHENVADFVTNDSGATGSDNWTVNANVDCEVAGCTRTPGYWKTHSVYGPAEADDTWEKLPEGADTIFFLSGQTYYEVLWTAPEKGNAYYILAHAYIAAELNQKAGASIPDDVLDAFEEATGLFELYTPDAVLEFEGKEGKEARQQFIDLAKILDDYNNGLTGPGHCS